MNHNLLIVGAGIYGAVAKEVADDMGCFENIAFVDDNCRQAFGGMEVVGTCADIERLSVEYDYMIVAIGNPGVRLALLHRIEDNTRAKIAILISPKAYISSSARIEKGTIIEPMVVVHANAIVSTGCIISAGAVVNHAAVCGEGVHLDCNATVAGMATVPPQIKVNSGEVYK